MNGYCERYVESNIVITRELAGYGRWGEDEIQERGRQLAKEAVRIWTGPKEQVARPVVNNGGDDESPDRRELRTRFWRGLNDYLVSEYPDLPDFEVRPSPTIRLSSGLRHIGFELRLGLRHRNVGIDVWFWREASLPVWKRIREAPDEYNSLVGTKWEFEQIEDQPRARMSVNYEADVRAESQWPDLYRWLGEALSRVYTDIAPKLRQNLDRGSST